MGGMLYIVGAPIGNLEDITLRALRTLRECDAVLCEDTRVSAKLLARHGIVRPLRSYHAHSGLAKYDAIVSLLQEGKHLALLTDAGTPAISDPGAELVRVLVERCGDDVRVEVIPGPSAVIAALSVSGVSADAFTFLGFPPHKKGRATFFDILAREERTVVFYESPHRILKALDELRTRLDESCEVVVARELTKVHEEVVRGTATDVCTHFKEHPDTVRGEFVVVVSHERHKIVRSGADGVQCG